MLRFLLPVAVWGLNRTYNPLPEYKFSWTADTVAGKLHTEIVLTPPSGQTVGWVGFGIAGGAGGMLGGDMFTAYSTGATTCAIQDRRASNTVKELPQEDTTNPDGFADWILDSCSLNGGVLTIAATRAFVTYDVRDLDFVGGPMTLLFAWGKTTPTSPTDLMSHNGGHVPREVSLWGEAVVPFDTALFESDYDTQVLKMDNVSIGNQTSYTCRGFNLTMKNNNATQAIAFEPIIDPVTLPYVHHIVVYACSTAMPDTLFECVNMPPACQAGIMYAWGKGGNPFVIPSVTGLDIATGGRTFVALQMHYNNVDDVQNLVDSSGVAIYRTNQLRTTKTAFVFVGTIQVNLTYGMTRIGVSGACNQTVTNTWPASGINVYSSFVHAHQRGRRIWTNLMRNGTFVSTLGNNQAYDFNLQKIVALSPSVTIFPGDILVTYCTYDTSNDTSNIVYGEETSNEMCINFLAFYPAFNVKPAFSCGVAGNPESAAHPGSTSCVLLPDHPPASYVVKNWTVADTYYLTGGEASCAPGFEGSAVLGCPGYGAPFTFAGCRRSVNVTNTNDTLAPTPMPVASSAFVLPVFGAASSLIFFA